MKTKTKLRSRTQSEIVRRIAKGLGRFTNPTKMTYVAKFIGGVLDGRQQAMYGRVPWPYFDKSEHIGNADGNSLETVVTNRLTGEVESYSNTGERGHATYTRRSNFYVLAEPLKRVPPGCPTLIYQYNPSFVPPVKAEDKQLV